jgi:hypothetical protein
VYSSVKIYLEDFIKIFHMHIHFRAHSTNIEVMTSEGAVKKRLDK